MTGTISAVMRAIIDRVYPVGIIVDFAVEMDPNSAVGFGTQWQRIADGRALIASDASHPVGWAGGEASHTLTEAEMPAHNHAIAYSKDGNPYPGTGNGTFGLNMAMTTQLTTSTDDLAYYVTATQTRGTGQAHNNMQPSLAVARWKRVA